MIHEPLSVSAFPNAVWDGVFVAATQPNHTLDPVEVFVGLARVRVRHEGVVARVVRAAAEHVPLDTTNIWLTNNDAERIFGHIECQRM